MADVARHIRIFDKDPSDDLVTKRSAAIIAMSEAISKLKTHDELFQVAEDVGRALESDSFHVPHARSIQVEEAIGLHSPAFTRDGQDLQILTCLMLAVLEALRNAQSSATAWGRGEILAVSIWLSLGAQIPRGEPSLEALRTALLEASRDLINRSAERSRNRVAIPDPAVKITEFSDAKVAESVNKGLLKSIEALRQNAALDREELDMLLWSLGDWSVLQQQHFRRLPMQVAAVTAGIEGSKMLRRLPSEGHKHLVLRRVVDDSERTATEFATSLGEGAKPIRGTYSEHGHVRKFPYVFRLLAAISGEHVDTQSLGNRNWGARAMVEAMALRLTENNETVL